MIDELFSKLDQELLLAQKGIKSLNNKLNNRLKIEPKNNQIPATYKHVEKQAPSFPFTKSTRFSSKKEELNETQQSFASFSTNPSLELSRRRTPCVVFPKSDRFMKKNNSENYEPINPDYTLKYKKPINAVIYKQSNNPNKGRSTIFTDHKDETLGSGIYYVKIDEKQKGGIFLKSKRFKIEEKDEKSIINPDYNVLKPKIKATLIKKEIEKTKKLKEKKKLDEFFTIIRAKYLINKPLENDKLTKRNPENIFIGKNTSESTVEEKRKKMIMFFNLVDKLKSLRKRGPGLYNTIKSSYKPCMVVYRSCSPIIRRLYDKNKKPAPNQYEINTNLINKSVPQYTFAKSPKQNKPKLSDFDLKHPLEINEDLIKKRVPNAIILPVSNRQKKIRSYSDFRENRLGPGHYNIMYEMIERRNDLGVLPYKLTEFNDREYQMNLANKGAFDGDINPNYDIDKPNKLVFQYYEPIDWKPPNPSDGMLFKQRWRFYDYNINAIKPEIKPIDFARNMNMKEYLQFEYELGLLENYLALREKNPDVGKYNVEYKQIDKNVNVPNIDKFAERDNSPMKNNEQILILNPDKPKPQIPTIDFGKQIPRDDKELKDEQILILNPSYSQIDKNIPILVNYEKGIEKEHDIKIKEEILDINIDYKQIEPKKTGLIDFGKLVSREDEPINKINERKEECHLNIKEDLVKPKITNLVNMEKGKKKFQQEKDENNNENIQNLMKENVLNAYEFTKPEQTAMKFGGYSGRENEGFEKEKKNFIIKILKNVDSKKK